MFGAALMLFTAWRSTGFIQGDEHFQVLEFANARLGLSPTTALAPEYAARARSFLLPMVAAAVRRAMRMVGSDDPFLCAFFLRAIASLLYLCCARRLARASITWFSSHTLWRWAVAGSLALWFVPVVAGRFSAESISGSLFFLALITIARLGDDEPCTDRELFLAGLALGFACVARFQVVFLEAGAAAWLVSARKANVRAWVIPVAAWMVALAAGLGIDRWGYGVWTFSAWNYYRYNITDGVLRQFGVAPWWWYFPALLYKAGPPFGVALIAGFIALCVRRPRSLLVWTAVPFVLFHLIVVHKEVRFLFPMLAAASYFVVLAVDALVPANARPGSTRWVRALAALVVMIDAGAFVIRMAVPLQPRIDVQAAVYHSPLRTMFIVGDGGDPYESFGLESYWYRPPGLRIIRAASVADAQRGAAAAGGALVVTRYPVVADTMSGACRMVHASIEARHPALFSRDLLEPLTPSPVREPWWWFVTACGARAELAVVR
ncbi:MAG TPA: hypothetical protein VGI97_00780 [Gemmatimonadaceae bacterium]